MFLRVGGFNKARQCPAFTISRNVDFKVGRSDYVAIMRDEATWGCLLGVDASPPRGYSSAYPRSTFRFTV